MIGLITQTINDFWFAVNVRDVAVPASTLARGPVSYTHLRAHETVLDLVCRLLLEKKNIQHTIVIYLLWNDTTQEL